jgi:plasmid replication initiation protein
MRKFLTSILKKIVSKLENVELPVAIIEEHKDVVLEEFKEVEKSPPQPKKVSKDKTSKKKAEVITYNRNPARDLMEIMEVPFLSLSKNRKSPILYESSDGTRKVKVTRHTGHFLASIYDWDVILFVASKMQTILNDMSDIPPRSMVVPRHELLKAIHRRNGKKTDADLEKTLSRLQLTGIETTIRNEDYKYKAGFGFLDSWMYTERKEIKEIEITLSQWLYDGICAKGSLLKVDPSYFELTSGLKRFLYRTARKHAGKNSEGWTFTVEGLYEKSGSENDFRKFKSKLKAAVLDNDIPEYSLEWMEKDRKSSVLFKKSTLHELDRLADKIEKEEKRILFNELKENKA